MGTPLGSRVGALMDIQNGVARLFGWGVYEGDFVPQEFRRALPDVAEEQLPRNPMIRLDDGRIVWGRECWFAPAEQISRRLSLCEDVILVDIEVERDAASSP